MTTQIPTPRKQKRIKRVIVPDTHDSDFEAVNDHFFNAPGSRNDNIRPDILWIQSIFCIATTTNIENASILTQTKTNAQSIDRMT